MKIKYIIGIIGLLLGLNFSSCISVTVHDDGGPITKGNGEFSTKNVTPSDSFSSIVAAGGLDIYLEKGTENNITLKADSNLFSHIKTEVIDGILRLYTTGNFRSIHPMKVYVTFTTLKKLKSQGGSDVYFNTPLETDSFTITGSGGSDINASEISAKKLTIIGEDGADISIQKSKSDNLTLKASGGTDLNISNLKATTLHLKSSGGSDVTLSGMVNIFTLEASGGSDVNAQYLTANTCVTNSTGASDVTVKVLDKLEGHVSGASDLTYFGNPQEVNTSGDDAASDISKG